MDDFVEENSPPAAGAGRLINNPWWWAGVLALLVALIGGFALLSEREKRLAREEYDKALADYRAAGLPEPFAAPASLPPVPTEAEGNLLFAPVFDGLAVFRLPVSGGISTFTANERSAIAAKAFDIGQFSYASKNGDWQSFDLAEHFARKAPLSQMVPDPKPGETPARAFIVALEREFPELKSLPDIEANHPVAVMPRPELPVKLLFEAPAPDFRSARAAMHVLTAYAGAKAQEGDGAPAAAAVCGLARWLKASRDDPNATLLSSMIGCVMAKSSLPRLTHLAIREGVWTDTQLRRSAELLGRVNMTDSIREALSGELRANILFLKGVGDRSSEFASLVARMKGQGGGILDGMGEAEVWRNAAAMSRDGVVFARTRNSDGQFDVAKLVARHDAILLDPDRGERAFLKEFMPTTNKVLANAGLTDAQLRSARLACALELHRRAHGAYPAKLEALVPEFLPALPLSPWAGGKLEYALTPAGYTLTWPKTDYYDTGLGGVGVDVKHPGPWEILGKEIELPARIRWFDTRTVTHPVVSPKDVVWTMPAPKSR